MATAVGTVNIDFLTNVLEFRGDMGKAAEAVSSARAKINKNLDRVARGFAKSRKSIKSFSKGLSLFNPAVATLAGSAGLGLVVTKSLEAADAIGKTADAANISTKKLQELRHAGVLYGAATRDIDDAVKRFNRRLGLFIQDGGGPAAKAFADLGVHIRDSSGNIRSTEAVLDDAITKLSQYENKALIAATASQLFGEDAGPRLANLIAAGSDEINRLSKEASRLGIVLSDDMIRASEAANDKLTVLSSVLKTKVIVAVASNAEGIGMLASRIVEAIPRITEMTDSFLKFFGVISPSKTEQLAKVNDEIESINRRLKTPVTKFIQEVRFGNADETLKKLKKERERLLKEIEAVSSKEVKTKIQADAPKVSDVSNFDETTKGFKEVENTAQSSLESIGRSIEETAISGKFQFKDMVDSIQNDIARLFIRQSITTPLVETLGGHLSGALGSAIGGLFSAKTTVPAKTVSVPKPLPTPTASVQSHVKKAIGGPVAANQPFLVGERGPEVFMPTQSGHIIPNRGGRGDSGITVNQTINLTVGVQQAVQGEVRRLMPEIKKATTAGVAKAIDRGGLLARKVGAHA